MNPFHRHTFDPEKWKLLNTILVHGEEYGIVTKLPMYFLEIYTNTCMKCGDLVSRKVKL